MNIHIMGEHNKKKKLVIKRILGKSREVTYGDVFLPDTDLIVKDNYTIVFKNSKVYQDYYLNFENNNEDGVIKLLEYVIDLGGKDHKERIVDLVCTVDVTKLDGSIVYKESSEPVELIIMDSPFSNEVDIDSVLYYIKKNRTLSNLPNFDYMKIHPFSILLSDIKSKFIEG